jgi:hypothetical protein
MYFCLFFFRVGLHLKDRNWRGATKSSVDFVLGGTGTTDLLVDVAKLGHQCITNSTHAKCATRMSKAIYNGGARLLGLTLKIGKRAVKCGSSKRNRKKCADAIGKATDKMYAASKAALNATKATITDSASSVDYRLFLGAIGAGIKSLATKEAWKVGAVKGKKILKEVRSIFEDAVEDAKGWVSRRKIGEKCEARIGKRWVDGICAKTGFKRIRGERTSCLGVGVHCYAPAKPTAGQRCYKESTITFVNEFTGICRRQLEVPRYIQNTFGADGPCAGNLVCFDMWGMLVAGASEMNGGDMGGRGVLRPSPRITALSSVSDFVMQEPRRRPVMRGVRNSDGTEIEGRGAIKPPPAVETLNELLLKEISRNAAEERRD